MKGLIIGLTFALKVFFEFLSSATFLLFYLLRHSLSDYITVYYAEPQQWEWLVLYFMCVLQGYIR